MVITEYVNIFNIIRKPFLYEFVKYFKNIENKYDSQSQETKLNIDDYFSQIEDISQEIIIIMVFNIESNEEEIKKVETIIKESLKINEMDKEIFKL